MALNNQLAASKYGKALFELAVEENLLASTKKEVVELQKVFKAVPELGAALTDIRLSAEQKKEIFSELTTGAGQLIQNLLHLVYDNKRMNIMPYILEDFLKRYDAHLGIIKGVVTTSVPIDQKTKDKIATSVAAKFGIDNVDLEEKVDEKIVGGVIVEANNLIIDGSVRTQLNRLRNLLK